jgi:hypothetical protein
MVMTVDAGGIFDQVGIFDVPPPITITDTGMFQVVWLMARATSWQNSMDFGIDGLLSKRKRRPVAMTSRPGFSRKTRQASLGRLSQYLTELADAR